MQNKITQVRCLRNSPISFSKKSITKFLAGFMLCSSAISCAWSSTYYVDPNGNDSNSGTLLNLPLKTIQKAMNKAIAGDTVYLRGGVYREQVDVMRGGGNADKMLNVFAYNDEIPIIRGSDQVTGWVHHSGNIWKKTGWAYNSQQVFVGENDSPPLQQIGMPSRLYTSFEYPQAVGSGVTSMKAGSFYYDVATTTLYVWLADNSNPNTQMVEASTRQRLFFMGVPYIHLKGLVFRHSNTSAYKQIGAAVELSSNSVIEQSDIQYTDFTGLQMGYMQTGALAINCNVSNNGDSGINAAASYGFRVFNVKMNNNNTRNFNPLWHAGGFKAATKAYGTVEFSEASHNNGSGIWFDYANGGNPIVVRNNYLHDNGPKEAAIFFEVSKNGLIYNNVIANNKRRGIYISASDNTRVYNNTIVATGDYAGIELGGMPRSGATLTNNAVYNNSISHGTSKYDLAIAAANGTSITGNTSDYNNFYRPAGALQLFMGSMSNTLASFIKDKKLDAHSLNVNPGFVAATTPPIAANYAVTSSSPLVDKGIAVAGVSLDYMQTARAQGTAFDIGAFEYAEAGTAVKVTIPATIDTLPPVMVNAPLPAPAPAPAVKDTIPPVVSLATPAPNTVIKRGSLLTIKATAADNVNVKGMSLYVDGGNNVRSGNGQVSFTWNSAGARLGTHSIKISASDDRNNLGKLYVTFKVN